MFEKKEKLLYVAYNFLSKDEKSWGSGWITLRNMSEPKSTKDIEDISRYIVNNVANIKVVVPIYWKVLG